MTADRVAECRVVLAGVDKALESANVWLAASRQVIAGHDHDPAVVSGVSNGATTRKRWDADFRTEADAAKAVTDLTRRRAIAADRLAQAEIDAAAPCDIDSLHRGDLVRDGIGWWEVVRVNAKTVTIETGHSWDRRIDRDQIVETRTRPDGSTVEHLTNPIPKGD